MTHSPTTPANLAQGVSKLLERSADHVKMAKAIGNFGIASHLVAELSEALTAAIGTGGQAITQFRKAGCSDWYDGLPDNEDGRGPYETRTLYSHPAPSGMAAPRHLSWIDVLREWFGDERYARDHEYLDANYSDQARRVAAYAATLAHPVQPGWQLVPEEPTEAMIEAGVLDTKADVSFFDVEETYRAMLAAAPLPEGRGRYG